jgi:hypothetical protein
MKAWKNRTTLPIDNNTGTIFKIEMNLSRSRMHPNERTIINMGAHLMTNDITEEVTICTFDDRCVTYEMGNTYSSPASLEEIADWVAEKIEDKAILAADYEREMAEEEFLQRDGNIY